MEGLKIRFGFRIINRMKAAVLALLLAGGLLPADAQELVPLPPPRYPGTMSVEEALNLRRTVRAFEDEPLSLQDVAQLLWTGGGSRFDCATGASRTYPSAGGIYPLQIYLVAGNVQGLDRGVYVYAFKNHTLKLITDGDLRNPLARAALGQGFLAQAPALIVITAEYSRTEKKYGLRGGERYVPLDAGLAAQSIHLQATALGLATATVGAFTDSAVRQILQCGKEEPLLIIPVGRPES